MIRDNQFAVYQMKQAPETRQVRFRSYKTLQEKGIRIRQEDYEQVYMGTLHPQDTPENVRERLDMQLPRSFAGHSISVSDVLVFHRMGNIISYYVEKSGFTVIEGFIKSESNSSGSAVSIDTANFQIEGKAGRWLAFDSIRLDGQEFFLMEHETYGKEAAWVVVDLDGKLVADNVRNGFDQEVKKKLEEYLHLSQLEAEGQEEIRQQSDSTEQKNLQLHQEEDRPDKTLSAAKGIPSEKKLKGRQSVLAKLHKKQAEIAQRSKKKERQAVAENDMERERK